ncbi:hypothetical protein [Micromonospora chalcea]|uniref:hypothetical protein n=1 Tax=Micromonospora chalcea TaxID=1874 RepID=UPI0037B18E21
MKIEFNGDWQKDLERMAVEAVKEKDQPVLDRLHREYSGRPVSEVKPAVAKALGDAGWTLSNEELDDYATLISEGTRIVLE